MNFWFESPIIPNANTTRFTAFTHPDFVFALFVKGRTQAANTNLLSIRRAPVLIQNNLRRSRYTYRKEGVDSNACDRKKTHDGHVMWRLNRGRDWILYKDFEERLCFGDDVCGKVSVLGICYGCGRTFIIYIFRRRLIMLISYVCRSGAPHKPEAGIGCRMYNTATAWLHLRYRWLLIIICGTRCKRGAGNPVFELPWCAAGSTVLWRTRQSA